MYIGGIPTRLEDTLVDAHIDDTNPREPILNLKYSAEIPYDVLMEGEGDKFKVTHGDKFLESIQICGSYHKGVSYLSFYGLNGTVIDPIIERATT